MRPALPPKAIILNCFGRGGSSIVWNMIGSSPDVLMPAREWHQAVFDQHHLVRKAMRRVGQVFDWGMVPGLSGLAASRLVSAIPPSEYAGKPRASHVVLKLMDHHLVFGKLIGKGFAGTTNVVLTRHPLPMCEGLMRSGLDLESAIRWYVAVTRHFSTLMEDRNTVVLRFEDLIAAPTAFCTALYERLQLPLSEDRAVKMKMKPFGSRRTKSVDVAVADIVRVPLADLPSHVAPDVNRAAVARLSPEQRQLILRRTLGSTPNPGYEDEGY